MPRGRAPSQLAKELVSSYPTLKSARTAAKDCRACDLWKCGTQTVFGEGSSKARVMLMVEQPGDREDLEGKPFVGPAGALLDKALAEAGVDRKETYITNAVKHFKWEPRGKRRIHKKPDALEVAACRSWLDLEIAIVQPDIVVCLGATATQALLGRDFRVTRQRGQLLPFAGNQQVLATVHPSSILRAPDEVVRHREFNLFVRDLRVVTAALLGSG